MFLSHRVALLSFAFIAVCSIGTSSIFAADAAKPEIAFPASQYRADTMEGWKLHIYEPLEREDPEALRHALALLRAQLIEVVRVVPKPAVEKLREVPLWVSPVYPKSSAKAEYHPGLDWLRDNGRDPALLKCVEFTNVAIFEKEAKRMPVLALHELAHAYHDRVLGFDHAEIKATYEKAVKSKSYEKVERDRKRIDRAYALTNPQEYFAETSEAFFGVNDFYPYNREDLHKHDPDMERLLEAVWSHPPAKK